MTQKTGLNEQEKEPESGMASSPFFDFRSLGAGVTPAEGSVKPTRVSLSIKFLLVARI
jgi:hypothetical protein